MQLWFGCVSGNSLLPNLEDICKKKKKTHTGITTLLCSTSSSSNNTFDALLAQGFVVIKITDTTILTLTGRGHGWWRLRR